MKIINPLIILKNKFHKSKKIENKNLPLQKSQSVLKIDQLLDSNYEIVKIHQVGLVDPFAIQGVLVLKTDDGKEFPISSFSGDVARSISNFIEDNRSSLPTIYNMIEQICEESELLLVKVKLYQSGDALRANLYFTGKKDLVLRNYRASDALALAAFYSVPILVRKDLFTEKATVK
ncbi:MAG TPA: bifunctional nuclease domain-containing protein [Nitrosopumilaceae archaeon]|nr:bifunctional nuclease domain-containing protein [Nitrosopumilaceae archaeon]